MSVKRFSPVLVEEKLRVLKSGFQNAFVAVLNDVDIIFAAVANRDEKRHQSSADSLYGEIALVVAHGSYHGFGGQFQIFFLERTRKCRRIFDKIQNLFQQVVGNFCNAAFRRGNFFNLRGYHFAAFVLVDDNEIFFASLDVIGGGCNFKFSALQTIPNS